MSIKENLEKVRESVRESILQSGRKEGQVKLMAVSKFHSVEEIKEAIDAGQTLFGENRVQEVCQKFDLLFEYKKDIELHIIGQLQTNKVKNAVKYASCIESVDRIELIKEIEKACAKINKNIKIFFEYHTAEDSKSGYMNKEELFASLEYIAEGNTPHITTCGFMTMAPFTDDSDKIRDAFRKLKEVQKEAMEKYPQLMLSELSMGMSGDYKIAIEEGSTLVRVGTAIFGERNYNK